MWHCCKVSKEINNLSTKIFLQSKFLWGMSGSNIWSHYRSKDTQLDKSGKSLHHLKYYYPDKTSTEGHIAHIFLDLMLHLQYSLNCKKKRMFRYHLRFVRCLERQRYSKNTQCNSLGPTQCTSSKGTYMIRLGSARKIKCRFYTRD